MEKFWILIILLVVVVALYYSGALGKCSGAVQGAFESITGGAGKAKAKPKAKSTTKSAKKAPKASKTDSKPEKKAPQGMPDEGWGINDSDACVKQAESGNKTVIARLSGEYFKNMKVGDKVQLKVKDSELGVSKKIKAIKNYKTFKEMLTDVGVDQVFPGGELNTVDDAIAHYRQYYNEEAEEKRGVIALMLE